MYVSVQVEWFKHCMLYRQQLQEGRMCQRYLVQQFLCYSKDPNCKIPSHHVGLSLEEKNSLVLCCKCLLHMTILKQFYRFTSFIAQNPILKLLKIVSVLKWTLIRVCCLFCCIFSSDMMLYYTSSPRPLFHILSILNGIIFQYTYLFFLIYYWCKYSFK